MKRIIIVLFLLLGVGMNAQLFNGWVSNSKTTSEINALVSPLTGRFEYNSTTGTIWVFNGTIWVDLGAGGGGTSDHGALTGLTDDDHTQYHNDTRAASWLNALYPNLDTDSTNDGDVTQSGSNTFSGTNSFTSSPFFNGGFTHQGTANLQNGDVVLPGSLTGVNSRTQVVSGNDPTGQASIVFLPSGLERALTATPTDITYNGTSLLGGGSGTDDQTAPEVATTIQNGVTQANVQAELEKLNGLTHTDSQNASAVPVGFTPTNYTPSAAEVQGHLSGIDTALGSLSGVTDGDKEDITVSGDTWNIDADAVGSTEIADGAVTNSKIPLNAGIDLSKLASINPNRFLGNDEIGSTSPQSITMADARTMLNVEDNSAADQTSLEVPYTNNSQTTVEGALDDLYLNSNTLGEETATATRTALLTDSNGLVNVNNASDVTYTIPTNASVAFETGTILTLFQEGTGDIIIAYSGGVTGEEARTFGVGQKITLWKTATDTWQVISRPSSATLTQAEYDALTTALKNNGTAYFIVP